MASIGSLANKQYYDRIMAADHQPTTPEAAIAFHDVHWPTLAAEPVGVVYQETQMAGRRALWIVPDGGTRDRLILHAHGGGFVSGSVSTHRKMLGHLARASACCVAVYDYPYAHEAKYPAQVDTALAVYHHLLRDGFLPKQIVLSADSCGAMLAMGTLQRLRAAAQPLPAAVLLLSAWLDMTLSSTGYDDKHGIDLFFTRERCGWLVRNVLGTIEASDPLASPLLADLTGFPPIYMQVGGDEALSGENQAFVSRAVAAGVAARLDVFPGMLHSFQMMAGQAPEADEAINRLGAWVRDQLEIHPVKVPLA